MKTIVNCIVPYAGFVYSVDDPGVILHKNMLYILDRGYFSIPTTFNLKDKIYLSLSSIVKVLRSKKGSLTVEQGKLKLTTEDAKMKKEITLNIIKTDRDVENYPHINVATAIITKEQISELAEVDSITRNVSKAGRETFCGVYKVEESYYFIMGDMKHAWIKLLVNKFPYDNFSMPSSLFSNILEDECTVMAGTEVNANKSIMNICVVKSEKYKYLAAFDLRPMDIHPNKVIEVYKKAELMEDYISLTVEADLLSRAVTEMNDHMKKTKSTDVTLIVSKESVRITSGSAMSKAQIDIAAKSSEEFTLVIDNPDRRSFNKIGTMYGDFEVTFKISKKGKIMLLQNPYVNYMCMYNSLELKD